MYGGVQQRGTTQYLQPFVKYDGDISVLGIL